jgi:hypothetical protein
MAASALEHALHGDISSDMESGMLWHSDTQSTLDTKAGRRVGLSSLVYRKRGCACVREERERERERKRSRITSS